MLKPPRSLFDQAKSSVSNLPELKAVTIFSIKETVPGDLFDEDGAINFPSILKHILLPFFRIKARYLQREDNFKIGEIQFRVVGALPSEGRVTENTIVQCYDYLSCAQTIERLMISPTTSLHTTKRRIMEKYVTPHFKDTPILLCQGETIMIKDHSFTVTSCLPDSGVVDSSTRITIEDKYLKPIERIEILPVKDDLPEHSCQSADELQAYIFHHYIMPFFNGWNKFVEKASVLEIENVEFKITNSEPEKGIVTDDTILYIMDPKSREETVEMQIQEDLALAQRLHRNENSVLIGGVTAAQLASIRESSTYSTLLTNALQSSRNNSSENGQESASTLLSSPSPSSSSSSSTSSRSSRSRSSRHLRQRRRRIELLSLLINRDSTTVDQGIASQLVQELDEASGDHLALIESLILESAVERSANGMSASSSLSEPNNSTPQYIVNRLPTHKISPAKLKARTTSLSGESTDEDDPSETCLICLVDYEQEEEVRTLPCMHYFHMSCIDKW
eukprot:CAMPEP_0115015766 /NCGR_PEP_ID=MMETSP0216-20121206/26987_1 /TAXON_ID=223996 /ORGANISM="Protocruzia adherens, Strain Boccale" /LENGTH=505 /DNA_ID=CAMNT_0002385995 /DNA_START=466 /DNA_END=1980 /DNA_ORIENTATION=-